MKGVESTNMFETLKTLLAEELQLDPNEITMEAELANDLGFKSKARYEPQSGKCRCRYTH